MATHATVTLTTYDLCKGTVIGTATVTDPPCPAGCGAGGAGVDLPNPVPNLGPGAVLLVTQVLHLGSCTLDPPVCVAPPACPLPDCPDT